MIEIKFNICPDIEKLTGYPVHMSHISGPRFPDTTGRMMGYVEGKDMPNKWKYENLSNPTSEYIKSLWVKI